MLATRNELLMYIKSISNERDLAYEEVCKIFADALAQAIKKTSIDYREAEFRVDIDILSGETSIFRRWRVLDEEEEMEAPEREVPLTDARGMAGGEDMEPGDIIEKPLEDVKFDQRVCMQSAKQHLNARLRDAERRQLMKQLEEKDERLINGQVMRVLREHGDAIVEVRRVDCRLPKSETIPRETLRVGDRIQAWVKEMIDEPRGQQIILTRNAPEFLKDLFKRVVPEIEKGILEIVGAVRAPGNRAKIAVRSDDSRVDPVGTCVGIRGSRVQAVTNELNGERIDIIHWHADAATYVLRALTPANVTKINVDRERLRMDVLVDQDSLAQAIGKNGANVRLASELTGWELRLRTPEEYEKEAEEILLAKSETLAETLNLDVEVARILCEEGFETPENVAYAAATELTEIEGFEKDVVDDIQRRAKEMVETMEAALREKLTNVDSRLVDLPDMDDQLLYDLVDKNILTLSDFAELSVEDLLELVQIPAARAGVLIMAARNLETAAEEND